MMARRAMIAFTISVYGATQAMVIFLLTDPVGWAILLAGALVILYFKWKKFHDAVNGLASWIFKHKYEIAASFIQAFDPFLLLYETLKHIRAILHEIAHPFSWLFGGGHGGGTNPSFGTSFGGGAAFSPIYSGGHVQTSFANKSPGPAVRKIGAAQSRFADNLSVPIELHNTTKLEADGKQLAEVVSKHRLDARARR